MDVVERGDGHHWRDVLAGKRERFVGLIQQGVANSEACRIVGVNRRTGTRWRYGRTVINRAGERLEYPPVKPLRTRSRPSSVRYLTLAERIVIADLHRDGGTVTTIVAELGRAVSTISRELRRNMVVLREMVGHAQIGKRRLPVCLLKPSAGIAVNGGFDHDEAGDLDIEGLQDSSSRCGAGRGGADAASR